ncbi:MAG: mechanosensitive ion channel family protein [Chloroherpetonaceae bacterium]|nr:mechanosensitive ion channel family protein [Chloroherpetonaceae bacterium]MCS7210136.1 mechanosensitive ion channel family protein [Chloroherpetonaceae bacterium]
MDALQQWLESAGIKYANLITLALGFIFLIVVCYASHFIARRILLAWIHRLAQMSTSKWDDVLVEHKTFDRVAHLAPAVVLQVGAPFFFPNSPDIVAFLGRLNDFYIIWVAVAVSFSLLNATAALYLSSPKSTKEFPIKVIVQVFQIVAVFVGAIFGLAILLNESPLVLLSGLGAITAVLLIIFRDALLGFTAGIQIATNRLVAIGDWIVMPKYDADGTVTEIALTTVRVQNWDNTFTIIPTYALISESFKNWRSVFEMGARRIKRSINIDIHSVKFLDEAAMERLSKIKYIAEYIEQRRREAVQEGSAGLVDERRITNLGAFRAYVFNYIKNHPKIHKGMTFNVRHLQPTENGIPIEIWAFTTETSFVDYENVQAEIFNHIIAIVPEFELRIFQRPTGYDMRQMYLTNGETKRAAALPQST